METLLVNTITVAFILGFMALARRFWPAGSRCSVLEISSGEERRFKRTYTIENLLILILVGPFLYIWYIVLTTIVNRLFDYRFGDALFLIRQESIYWVLISLALGFITSIFMIEVTVKKWLKDDYLRYLMFINRLKGYNTKKVIGFCISLTFVAAGVGIVLGLNNYVSFDNEAITVNRFFSIVSSEYSYGDIQRVIHYTHVRAPNGNILEKPYYAIVFSDGNIWRTSDDGRKGLRLDGYNALIHHVLARSNRDIETEELED